MQFEQFYEDLDQIIRSAPANYKLIVLGDFNVRVGRDNESWDAVLGRHVVGKTEQQRLTSPQQVR